MIGHRGYRSEADIERMEELLMAGRAASRHSGYLHIGDLEWRVYYARHGMDLADLVHLWEEDRELRGFCVLGEDGFDHQVIPSLRGSALEDEIIAWGEARTIEWTSRGGEAKCTVESFVDDAPRIAILARRGYAHMGDSGPYFARSLEGDVPMLEAPAGFEVRGLRDGDVESRARAHFEAFSPGSKMTAEYYRGFMRAPSYDRDLDSVAIAPDGAVAAYAMAWLDRQNLVGEFEPVGTRPEFQRRGLGRAVLLRGLRKMQGRGMREAIVYTNGTNDAAIALYRSVGFVERNRFANYALRLD
jgi:ribosomal protein S18 acetylase RimI-like enzyme